MAKLIYVANVSLDGCIEDAHGSFEWTAPIDEVFTFITDLVRPAGTYLYGRRLYETMAVWETQPALAAQSDLMAHFADVWQAADKIVYSATLHVVSTANTRLERRFDADSVRDMKSSDRSTPSTSIPRRASASAWRPGPHPASSTRSPGWSSSASTRNATSCAVPFVKAITRPVSGAQ